MRIAHIYENQIQSYRTIITIVIENNSVKFVVHSSRYALHFFDFVSNFCLLHSLDQLTVLSCLCNGVTPNKYCNSITIIHFELTKLGEWMARAEVKLIPFPIPCDMIWYAFNSWDVSLSSGTKRCTLLFRFCVAQANKKKCIEFLCWKKKEQLWELSGMFRKIGLHGIGSDAEKFWHWKKKRIIKGKKSIL